MKMHPMSFGSPIQWPQHWTNGGTGITRFSEEDLPAYEQAVAEWNAVNRDRPLRVDKHNLSLHELPHTKTNTDLGKFWRLHELISEQYRARPKEDRETTNRCKEWIASRSIHQPINQNE